MRGVEVGDSGDAHEDTEVICPAEASEAGFSGTTEWSCLKRSCLSGVGGINKISGAFSESDSLEEFSGVAEHSGASTIVGREMTLAIAEVVAGSVGGSLDLLGGVSGSEAFPSGFKCFFDAEATGMCVTPMDSGVTTVARVAARASMRETLLCCVKTEEETERDGERDELVVEGELWFGGWGGGRAEGEVGGIGGWEASDRMMGGSRLEGGTQWLSHK